MRVQDCGYLKNQNWKSLYVLLLLCEEMNLLQRYRKLTFWNKVAFWGSIASIIALMIPVVSHLIPKKSKVSITPKEFIAHPLYQEFTAHVINNNDYPIYDYSVLIMVKNGNLNVNTDLKFEPIEKPEKDNSDIPIKAFGLGGISNKYKLSYMELHFPTLEARSTQKYMVKINGEKYKDRSIIEFTIGSFKKEPHTVYSMPIQLDKDGNFPKKLPLPESMKK